MGIEVRNVGKRFGATVALDQVSLSIEEGHIYGLLGSNGAGKTTLLNIITGRLFSEGTVTVDGEIAAENDAALGKLCMVGEQNLFPDDMRVGRAYRTAAMFYEKFDLAEAERLSAQFGLNWKQKITALSTGYATIFRLIMALSSNAPYLLLDEPVLGLDAQHRDLFYRLLLERFSRGGCTVVLSTHLIAEVDAIVDHVFIIRDGRVVRDAERDALLAGCHTVTGPTALVDAYLTGKILLSETVIGGLKTASVQGEAGEAPEGVTVGRMDLQQYFISLMNAEDAQK